MTGVRGAPPGGCVVRFLTYGTWGVLYPFFPVWLLDQRLFSAADCGLITGAAVLAGRLGSLVFVRVLPPGSERRCVAGSQIAMAAAAAAMYAMALLTVRSLAGWVLVSAAFGLAGSLATLAQLTLIGHRFGPVCQTLAVAVSGGRTSLAVGSPAFVWGLAESLAVAAGLWLLGAGLGAMTFLAGAGAAVAVVVIAAVFHRRFSAMAITAEAVPAAWRAAGTTS